MKVSTDCPSCPFVKACPMVEEHQRLPPYEGYDYEGCDRKRASGLHMCGHALQPNPAGREDPKDNAKGLPD